MGTLPLTSSEAGNDVLLILILLATQGEDDEFPTCYETVQLGWLWPLIGFRGPSEYPAHCCVELCVLRASITFMVDLYAAVQPPLTLDYTRVMPPLPPHASSYLEGMILDEGLPEPLACYEKLPEGLGIPRVFVDCHGV